MSTAASSPLLARLEARKAAKESRSTESMKAELEAKMEKASSSHTALLKSKAEAAAKDVALAKALAQDKHERKENDEEKKE